MNYELYDLIHTSFELFNDLIVYLAESVYCSQSQ